ncbi:type II secretion system protein [uncultured Clostridium sp.]|uniref:PilW family protein n=1 Tax=uncultured Clostridium sp. TaxID=59620 RepID=UPI0025E5C324|nr:type II secretion system protein [uncultured Clostridium sp.]
MSEKKSGFTLIEMIIVLAITVIVIGIVMGVFMTGHRVFAQADVRTTLQMQGKDIQEKISNICMEGSEIKSVSSVAGSTDKINSIEIVSFYKSGTSPKLYKIELNGSYIKINGNDLYGKVKSIKINDKIVDESKKISPDTPNYSGFSSIDFNIILTDKKGFSGEIDYPVNFTVYFRNKGKS